MYCRPEMVLTPLLMVGVFPQPALRAPPPLLDGAPLLEELAPLDEAPPLDDLPPLEAPPLLLLEELPPLLEEEPPLDGAPLLEAPPLLPEEDELLLGAAPLLDEPPLLELAPPSGVESPRGDTVSAPPQAETIISAPSASPRELLVETVVFTMTPRRPW